VITFTFGGGFAVKKRLKNKSKLLKKKIPLSFEAAPTKNAVAAVISNFN